MALADRFDPEAIERTLYAQWEDAGCFAPSGNGAPYCIAIPPPNITDRLHLGHAFQHTLMDALIRYQRMNGRRVLWQTGTDHAQIATQMVVERQLLAQGVRREELGRDAFIDRVWEWKRSTGGSIARQIRRLGSSVDWRRERFTMDEGFSRAVAEVFVRLFDEGLIYRGKRLVNWDPVLGTSISDLEVENREEQGHLWHLRYPLADGARTAEGKDHLVVATTRPETLFGDTAVAVHPEDDRFRALIGAEAVLPLVGRRLPIIADAHVDRGFGSGCVKITPAHDFNDYAIGRRHGLAQINIFNADATLNGNAPPAYRGLDRFAARDRAVAELDAQGLVERIEAHRLTVPRGDRSGAAIEPWLTDQWFVRIAPLAEPAIRAVENGDVAFVPRQYENVYFSWMRRIEDWCISRQQWWGHRIPAWHDPDGNVHVGRSEDEARARAGLAADVPLRRDDDVLDTWFSSALWTFGTLGWPERTPELAAFHPTAVLVTGYDIIFFWVARMLMLTLKFTGEVPFRTVYIHGMVRDADGVKMSKTKGNGLDPLDIVDGIDTDALVAKRTAHMTQPQMAAEAEARTRREYPDGIAAYGTDALRFTFCAMASRGRDLAFDVKRIEGYRNFCNKLWNASRFALMHVRADDGGPCAPSFAERWIRSRLGKLAAEAERAIAAYRFDLYAAAVYEFAWREYCDWYVEMTKPVLFDDGADPARRRAARQTLAAVLEALLRIAHPIMPFITETLWREIAPFAGADAGADADGTIMRRPFPAPGEHPGDAGAEAAAAWMQSVVSGIRNLRGEMRLNPGLAVDVLIEGGGERDRALLAETGALIRRLAKVAELRLAEAGEAPAASAVQVAGHLKLVMPLAGLIDIDAERARLEKDVDRLARDLARVDGKLGNAGFLAKAPAAVVEKERGRSATLRRQIDVLGGRLDALRGAAPSSSHPSRES